MAAPTPPFIPEAFAKNADPSRRNVIPDTTVNPQRASWSLGFPPQVMTPIVAGGKPMLGPDMNGTLYMLSSHTFYQQSGQAYRWNADVVSAIAGYAAGTVLGSTDGVTLWFNLVAGNATDPDDVAAAGWVPMYSYGVTLMPPTTGGVVTLTAAQATKNVIVLSGALIANLQVVLPNSLRRWLIVNNTSGSFVTTVKTAAGAGVAVPQGGYAAPTEVYSDGTNIYNVVAPITIPTDVAPTPNTIALRSNNGYIYASYFNQSSAPENFTISEVFASMNSDGFLRKINRANFAANFLLSQFAGQVLDGQVPLSAVNQYRGTILDNSALTGTPTAPTPSAGDSSTKVATTAFVSGTLAPSAGTVNTQGSARLPGGLILKMGYAQGAAGLGDIAVAFSQAFPNACWGVVACTANRNGAGSGGSGYVRGWSTAGFTVFADTQQTGTNGGTIGTRGALWIAVGN